MYMTVAILQESNRSVQGDNSPDKKRRATHMRRAPSMPEIKTPVNRETCGLQAPKATCTDALSQLSLRESGL
jgi:hypothetical protein